MLANGHTVLVLLSFAEAAADAAAVQICVQHAKTNCIESCDCLSL